MSTIELKELTQKLIEAETAQRAALEKIYPKGSRVWFNIQHGQVNPSSGTVTGHEPSRWGGSVVVLHSEAKPRSRYRYRRPSPTQIVRVEVQS